MKNKLRGTIAFPAAIAFMVGTPPLHVQASDAPSTDRMLEEVIVTAQKRTENLQRTPISVTAIGGDTIKTQGLSQIDDVLKNAPAIEVQGTARGFAVAIRGLGFDMPPRVGDNAVAFNTDGVYDARVEAGKTGFYDVDRVEVLRGPQGTLYGRNATAGIVNVITNDPSTEAFAGSGTVELGNYDLMRAEGMINVPVSESLALRGAFVTVNRSGYMSNGQNDNVSSAARVKALYAPSDDLSLLAGIEYVKLGGKGNGARPAYIDEPDDPWQTPDSGVAYNRSESIKVYTQIDWDLGFGVLTVLPAVQRFENEYYATFGGTLSQGHDPVRNDQITSEVRLSSPAGSSVQWVAGVYYYDMEEAYDSIVPTSTLPNKLLSTIDSAAESQAAFVQATVPISAALRLIGGVRYTTDDKDIYQLSTNRSTGESTVTDVSGSWSSTDYRAGLEFDLNDSSMLYATVATGYRPGGSGFGQTFDPEELTSYEIGSKNRFIDDSLQVNGSVFYYDYTDYQATDPVFSPGGVLLGLQVLNSPGAEIIGGELETVWNLSAADRLTFAAAYLDATYRELTLSGLSYDGFTLPHSPEWNLDASYRHAWTLSSGAAIDATLAARYTGENYVSVSQEAQSLQKAYTIGDASLGFTSADERWSVSAYVKNMTDEAVKTGRFGPNVIVGTPRTYGVVLSSQF